eukprot:CAMPEP_0178398122 /NCGR_PEP_ID=MMETSP0689_2-20121128/14611_1 /TAXON_ID=160604 /ORGANISM="Amphidinium massartii, Strain CS-259" /LENGTH=299 /DNA_ID=CAMNT_0020018877 /DNA_START=100 /DNA_END=999 /DNA_ORIENTATION=-
MAKFQVELSGMWKDYARDEDKILKRAFLAGFPNCKFTLRGATYEYNFRSMLQKNLTTGKERKIRAPFRWRQPSKPIVPKGPTVCIKVPPGSPGTTIQINHPHAKGAKINVAVPVTAKVGQAMLVPVPDVAVATEVSVTGGVFAAPAKGGKKGQGKGKGKGFSKGGGSGVSSGGKAATAEAAKKGSAGGWSTGSKVAAGAAVAAAAAGGVLAADIVTDGETGEMIGDGAEDAVEWVEGAGEDAVEWTEGAAEDVADWAEDAGIVDAAEDVGEWTAEAAEDAAEWIEGAAEDIGDFVMDLF